MQAMIRASAPTAGMIHATMVLTAAAGSDSGNVKLKGIAYHGGAMKVNAYGSPVAIEVGGIQLSGPIPLVADHSSSIAQRLGMGTATIEGGKLAIEASVTPGTPEADRAIQLARNGGISLSVGLAVTESKFIRKGETVTVNGRAQEGPLYYIVRSELVEVSAVGVGADRGARAIAANAPTGGAGDDAIKAERARVLEIQAAFAAVSDGEAEARQFIEAGASADEARARALALLKAQRPQAPAIFASSGGTISTGDTRDVIAAAHMLMAGAREAAERAYKGRERVLEAADAMRQRAGGLLGLMRECLLANHITPPRDNHELIRAANSTNDYPGAVAGAIRLVAQDALQTAAEPCLTYCARKPVQDFRQNALVRFAPKMALHKLPAGGEIKNISLEGKATAMQADTYASMVVIDRKDIINDELSHYSELPAHYGREAARTIGDIVEAVIAAGVTTFWTTSNGSYITGADTVLGIDGLRQAVVALRTQTDESGRTLNLAPAYLEVAPDDEFTARALVASAEVRNAAGTAAEPTGNPAQGIAKVLVNARMTSPQWRLYSAPQNAAVVLALLNGVLAPTVEVVDPGPDRLGMGYRCFIDFGAALHEYRAAVIAKGAA